MRLLLDESHDNSLFEIFTFEKLWQEIDTIWQFVGH